LGQYHAVDIERSFYKNLVRSEAARLLPSQQHWRFFVQGDGCAEKRRRGKPPGFRCYRTAEPERVDGLFFARLLWAFASGSETWSGVLRTPFTAWIFPSQVVHQGL
jgi:hypothetical protein